MRQNFTFRAGQMTRSGSAGLLSDFFYMYMYMYHSFMMSKGGLCKYCRKTHAPHKSTLLYERFEYL